MSLYEIASLMNALTRTHTNARFISDDEWQQAQAMLQEVVRNDPSVKL